MTGARSASSLFARMRIFECYPPSAFLVALATAGLLLAGGLALAVPFLAGVALAALGHALDLYGVRERE